MRTLLQDHAKLLSRSQVLLKSPDVELLGDRSRTLQELVEDIKTNMKKVHRQRVKAYYDNNASELKEAFIKTGRYQMALRTALEELGVKIKDGIENVFSMELIEEGIKLLDLEIKDNMINKVLIADGRTDRNNKFETIIAIDRQTVLVDTILDRLQDTI